MHQQIFTKLKYLGIKDRKGMDENVDDAINQEMKKQNSERK